MMQTEQCFENIESKIQAEAQSHPLVAAIRKGDASAASQAIASGADVNAPSPFDFRNPLALAFATNRNDLALLLLNSGANPDAPGRGGPVSAMAARYPKGDMTLQQAMKETAEALSILKTHGADLSLTLRSAQAEVSCKELLEACAEGRDVKFRKKIKQNF